MVQPPFPSTTLLRIPLRTLHLHVQAQMRDCGLTVAGFVSPKDLDLCHAAGLKAIVSDARVSNYDWRNVDESAARKNVESLLAEVGKQVPRCFQWLGT